MSWGGKRSRWLALAGAMALVSLVVAGSAGAATPTTLHGAAYGFPDDLDPQLSYTTEGWSAMYDTYIPLLTYRHASGKAGSDIVPGLARSLPRVTNGGRTYTLFLRPGLKYSDGTPVRASDFEFAIERLIKLYGGGAPFYFDIAGARRFERTGKGGIGGIATDNRSGRIVIHLVRPKSTFVDALALLFAAPVPPSTPATNQTLAPPPATGPYLITDVAPDGGWSYERNPEWSSNNGPLLPELPNPHVDRIEIKVVRSGSAQVRQVERGKVDWMLSPPPLGFSGRLRSRYGRAQFRAWPTLSTYYFWMNTTKAPFDDPRVREAVNLAVDSSALSRIYGGELTPTRQILPPSMPGYGRFDLYPYDLARARRLIAKADPADREITVWTDTERSNYEASAYYGGQLRKLGFTVHLKVISTYDYFTVIGSARTPNLDTGWANWFADYAHPDDFFAPLLGSAILPFYNSNFARLEVPALDAKIAALGRAQLGQSQERQYAKLDRSFMRLAPWVPFGTRTWSTFVSKRVDLGKLVWNPLFGTDLTSLRFDR